MQTLAERGVSLLLSAGPRSAGGLIVYQRGNERVEIKATFGRSEFNVESSAGGVFLEHTDRDFIIAAKDLILGGALATPERGDRITDLKTERVYETLPLDGQQCYRECDSTGESYRVYTKRVLA